MQNKTILYITFMWTKYHIREFAFLYLKKKKMYNQGFVRNSCGHDNTTSCANCTSPVSSSSSEKECGERERGGGKTFVITLN